MSSLLTYNVRMDQRAALLKLARECRMVKSAYSISIPSRPVQKKRSILPALAGGAAMLGGGYLMDKHLNGGQGLNALKGLFQRKEPELPPISQEGRQMSADMQKYHTNSARMAGYDGRHNWDYMPDESQQGLMGTADSLSTPLTVGSLGAIGTSLAAKPLMNKYAPNAAQKLTASAGKHGPTLSKTTVPTLTRGAANSLRIGGATLGKATPLARGFGAGFGATQGIYEANDDLMQEAYADLFAKSGLTPDPKSSAKIFLNTVLPTERALFGGGLPVIGTIGNVISSSLPGYMDAAARGKNSYIAQGMPTTLDGAKDMLQSMEYQSKLTGDQSDDLLKLLKVLKHGQGPDRQLAADIVRDWYENNKPTVVNWRHEAPASYNIANKARELALQAY